MLTLSELPLSLPLMGRVARQRRVGWCRRGSCMDIPPDESLAAPFPHPSLRATLPTRGRERELLDCPPIPIMEEICTSPSALRRRNFPKRKVLRLTLKSAGYKRLFNRTLKTVTE